MASKFQLSPSRWFFIALLAVGAFGVYFLVSHGVLKSPVAQAKGNVAGIYAADTTPEEIPEQLLPGLILLSVKDLADTPEVDGFQWPCGAPDGAMTYDAQPLGSENPKRGGYHTGADLNGIGGENSDEGMPVCAAARGLVVYCGKPSADWGNVVVLAHRIPGTDRIVQTLYAHLKDVDVTRGRVVERGRKIGTIGTADGLYLAHLHFEVVESRCTEAGMPGYHPAGTMNRLDPATFISQYPAPRVPDVYPAVRRMLISPTRAPYTKALPVNNTSDSHL